MLFEIIGDDIARLGDEDLRTLIGRLCEAELSRKGFSKAAVTYGGNQTASDGGIDVRVQLDPQVAIDGFIPRWSVGMQSKISDMPPKAVEAEMRPKDVLRPVIAELAEQGGAYVIVSSNGSVADSALKLRKAAMRKALADCPHGDQLLVDFYDRQRLATWVRDFPALENWVRARIGRPLQGWRHVENWSNPTEPETAEYLIDDKARIFDDRAAEKDPISVVEAVNRMRQALREPKTALRLVGLSGLGKTRLLQALFDARVGEDPLDLNHAIYTDIADEPRPSVRDMAGELVRQGAQGVLLIDNCPPDTHRALVETCAKGGSNISVITVEYDVRDDTAEGSKVFRLEPASDDVIQGLIERRHPDISAPARRRLTEFAGGNARVAIALAQTVGGNETLGDLTDEQLFVRLFNQRKPDDDGLLQSAEAASLVYSFDGETLDGQDAELPVLANLAGVSVEILHRHVAELRRRSLVQARSRWRALLPHALANRLARRALENLPAATVERVFQAAPVRLLKSFSRRLGYLHNSDAAVTLASRWLGEGGLVGDVAKLNRLGIDIFNNIAPAAPSTALGAIERGVAGSDGPEFISANLPNWASLLRSLAYEPGLFDRAVTALAKLALAGVDQKPHMPIRSGFVSLFRLHLSGTRAGPKQRLDYLQKLLSAPTHEERHLGLDALGEMLQATHFSSVHSADFGTRPRDYGWQPSTWGEIRAWYAAALTLIRDLVVGGGPLAADAQALLAKNLRSLVYGSNAFDEIEALVNELAARAEWPAGWLATKEALKHGRKDLPPDTFERLRSLEQNLSPTGSVATVRAYIFSNPWDLVDSDDDDDGDGGKIVSRFQRSSDRKVKLVRDLAVSDAQATKALLDQAVASQEGALVEFGRGLALARNDPAAGWSMVREAYANHPRERRSDSVACGYLQGVLQSFGKAAVHELLDQTVADEVLGEMYPRMQLFCGIDERDAKRILESLSIGLAPVWQYQYFELGRISDDIPSPILRDILAALARREGGARVALNILGMRYHSARVSEGRPLDETLLEAGRDLLIGYPFRSGQPMEEHHLAEVAAVCLKGPQTEPVARAVCLNYRDALTDYRSSAYMTEEFAATLFKLHPTTAMDVLMLQSDDTSSFHLLSHSSPRGIRPFDGVADKTIIDWASIDPEVRVPIVGRHLTYQRFAADAELTALGEALLALSPDKGKFLKGVSYGFWPSSWSGSLADVLTPQLSVLVALKSHSDAAVRAWATEMETGLLARIEHDRLRERSTDESFE